MFDNILWQGKVACEEERKKDAKAQAAFEVNQQVLRDQRFETNTIMIGDGLMIARKIRE